MYDTVSLWIVDHFRAITSFKAKDVSSAEHLCNSQHLSPAKNHSAKYFDFMKTYSLMVFQSN